jgi:hypothetical protein
MAPSKAWEIEDSRCGLSSSLKNLLIPSFSSYVLPSVAMKECSGGGL